MTKSIKYLILFSIVIFLVCNIYFSLGEGIDVGGGFGININVTPGPIDQNQTPNQTANQNSNNSINTSVIYSNDDSSSENSHGNGNSNVIAENSAAQNNEDNPDNAENSISADSSQDFELKNSIAGIKFSKWHIILLANTFLYAIILSFLIVLKIRINR
jgi:preprotein translocase subunit SecF